MTKQETSDQMIARIRKNHLKAMEGMTEAERSAYFREKYEQGKKRIDELRQKNAPRYEQVLIRLTEDERNWVEAEAEKNNSTMSAWIRDRVLGKKSPIDSLVERLDRIESLLKKQTITKKSRTKSH